jgi:hypothetical protein
MMAFKSYLFYNGLFYRFFGFCLALKAVPYPIGLECIIALEETC